jgi:transcriptional regulator with XRE-family HTH domain
MTSFRLKIDPKERYVSRFFGQVERAFQSAFVEAKKDRKLTQQKIAELLGVDRSVINRRLLRRENMTERTLAEMAWAMGYEIDLKLLNKSDVDTFNNHFNEKSNVTQSVRYSKKPEFLGNIVNTATHDDNLIGSNQGAELTKPRLIMVEA